MRRFSLKRPSICSLSSCPMVSVASWPSGWIFMIFLKPPALKAPKEPQIRFLIPGFECFIPQIKSPSSCLTEVACFLCVMLTVKTLPKLKSSKFWRHSSCLWQGVCISFLKKRTMLPLLHCSIFFLFLCLKQKTKWRPFFWARNLLVTPVSCYNGMLQLQFSSIQG